MTAMNRRECLERYVAEQRKWIAEHGGDLEGYILRYGSGNDANHYGNGGEAIYAADKAYLDSLVAQLGAEDERGVTTTKRKSPAQTIYERNVELRRVIEEVLAQVNSTADALAHISGKASRGGDLLVIASNMRLLCKRARSALDR